MLSFSFLLNGPHNTSSGSWDPFLVVVALVVLAVVVLVVVVVVLVVVPYWRALPASHHGHQFPFSSFLLKLPV